MGLELESIWDAMKEPYYQRIIRELRVSIAQASDLKTGLTQALNKVVQATHAEAGTCWFYDRSGDGRIRPKASFGGRELGDFSLAPGEGVAGQVIAKGKSIIIQECQKDPRWAGKADRQTGFTTKSMICVPLARKGQVFGSIQIINKTDGTPFDEKDLAFAENLADTSAELFETQHLLDGYAPAANAPVSIEEPTLSTLFSTGSFPETEEALLRLAQVRQLSETEQKHLLRLCREIWMILDKNRPAGRSPRPRF